MYAIIMSVFGQSVDGIHRGFILVNLTTIVFVFLIAKKLIGNFAAIIAAATFSLLTINYGVYGNAAHATHFVLLFALPGLLILLNSDDKSPVGRFLLAGLLIGLAPVMKQSGIFLLLFAASFLVLRYRLQHKTFFSKQGLIQFAYFCGGAVLPILLMLLTIYLSGCWTVFKFWSFDYAALYGNKFSLSDIGKILNNLTGTFQFVVNGWYLVWGIAIIGLIVLFVHKELKDPSKRLFLIILLFFSLRLPSYLR
jgi:4-amino-4-deoxy-L-arabinose transferase-like glycosyltransferase